MNNWHKKSVTLKEIEPLCKKYNLTQLEASVLVRRGITQGSDILYYLESDIRFQHPAFSFFEMEDAVERIIQAKEEGEKVLIFGDSDVDGITSTAILYEQLVRMGIDVQWRLPLADDAYGLSIQAVDDFAAQDGSLIITVDCGISNINEISHANDLGIEVIVTDHHNPPEVLPEAIIILDPKIEDSGYPFQHISGAAVAFKLVSALRFAETDFYNAEISILQITQNDENYDIDCLKIKNQVKIKELHEKVIPGQTSIYDLKLPYFLQGQLIYVWDSRESLATLKELFGSGIEFNLIDFREQASRVMPALKNKNAADLQSLSLMAKYNAEENSIIQSLYNLYVSYSKKINLNKHPELKKYEEADLQLVGLAALADIMPMQNENRIFVKNAVSSIKKTGPRTGLAELFTKLKLNREILTSTDLSWTVIPALNAAGRMGKSNLSLQLLISKDPKEREKLADDIFNLNEDRKNLVTNALFKIQDKASDSIKEHGGKLCLVLDESINKGVTGILAARLMQDNNLPAIAVTYNDNICVGSMRSCRGIIATEFLSRFGNFFINYGGHDFAAGFSFEKNKSEEFIALAHKLAMELVLEEEQLNVEVDAEIPPNYLTPEAFKLIDLMEPFGNSNPELVFMTSAFSICDAQVVGKKEPQHLKLTFDAGKYKIPAMYWSQAERLRKDISIGQKYDILYAMGKNYFNGMITNQIIIKDCIPFEPK
ncbi:MAG: single-stranded-DNA-specific exonuclease RecJ [Treponema sp.]|nr:single-stranded-DNA-specific exonuclease RecJ [Treponema sp.]